MFQGFASLLGFLLQKGRLGGGKKTEFFGSQPSSSHHLGGGGGEKTTQDTHPWSPRLTSHASSLYQSSPVLKASFPEVKKSTGGGGGGRKPIVTSSQNPPFSLKRKEKADTDGGF